MQTKQFLNKNLHSGPPKIYIHMYMLQTKSLILLFLILTNTQHFYLAKARQKRQQFLLKFIAKDSQQSG